MGLAQRKVLHRQVSKAQFFYRLTLSPAWETLTFYSIFSFYEESKADYPVLSTFYMPLKGMINLTKEVIF